MFSYNSVGWLGSFSAGSNCAHIIDCLQLGGSMSWKKFYGLILKSGNRCFRWMSSGMIEFTSMWTLTFRRLDWWSTWWSQGSDPRAQSQRMQGLLRRGLGSCTASLPLIFYWSKLSQGQPNSSSKVGEINHLSMAGNSHSYCKGEKNELLGLSLETVVHGVIVY